MIRVAIIGAGIGAEHLAGYRALPDLFQVDMLCDLNEARARDVAGDTLAVTADLDAVLSSAEIDLIDVCLPPHLHFEVSAAALNAGKHVVCEKPMVRSLAEADALARIAAEAGRVVCPVFQYRYGPATAQLDALIAAGLAGAPQVASVETHWNRDAAYYTVPWRGTWAGESGGAVLGHAIHNHDLLGRYFGPVTGLSAKVATRVNNIETEDCAAILMQFDTGALATSSVTLGAATDTSRLRLVFETLTATSGTAPYAPAEDIWVFEARDPVPQARIDAVLADVPPVKSGFAGFFEALAAAIDGQPGREVTLEDGRRSIELVTAIYDAARSGKRISLPLDANTALYQSWLPGADGQKQ
ncbi:Gfo/Idh/MocA family oxidoreductase [Rhodophyticola sp. CCM32]|uniref:Gfo/Idh/MocA family protein n=1 Tax=Rhodophyticola sp. CCM32 TaxID=2916397 RepID=UPI00107FC342|nr:Gfo/Idh/MocA family oxidoreductase [Rhodophyticola sp. CCM32]QBY00649.1 Gfo/Idh/MocA family oxidoreductase [Rhodophyticola sp. CCM32]